MTMASPFASSAAAAFPTSPTGIHNSMPRPKSPRTTRGRIGKTTSSSTTTTANHNVSKNLKALGDSLAEDSSNGAGGAGNHSQLNSILHNSATGKGTPPPPSSAMKKHATFLAAERFSSSMIPPVKGSEHARTSPGKHHNFEYSTPGISVPAVTPRVLEPSLASRPFEERMKEQKQKRQKARAAAAAAAAAAAEAGRRHNSRSSAPCAAATRQSLLDCAETINPQEQLRHFMQGTARTGVSMGTHIASCLTATKDLYRINCVTTHQNRGDDAMFFTAANKKSSESQDANSSPPVTTITPSSSGDTSDVFSMSEFANQDVEAALGGESPTQRSSVIHDPSNLSPQSDASSTRHGPGRMATATAPAGRTKLLDTSHDMSALTTERGKDGGQRTSPASSGNRSHSSNSSGDEDRRQDRRSSPTHDDKSRSSPEPSTQHNANLYNAAYTTASQQQHRYRQDASDSILNPLTLTTNATGGHGGDRNSNNNDVNVPKLHIEVIPTLSLNNNNERQRSSPAPTIITRTPYRRPRGKLDLEHDDKSDPLLDTIEYLGQDLPTLLEGANNMVNLSMAFDLTGVGECMDLRQLHASPVTSHHAPAAAAIAGAQLPPPRVAASSPSPPFPVTPPRPTSPPSTATPQRPLSPPRVEEAKLRARIQAELLEQVEKDCRNKLDSEYRAQWDTRLRQVQEQEAQARQEDEDLIVQLTEQLEKSKNQLCRTQEELLSSRQETSHKFQEAFHSNKKIFTERIQAEEQLRKEMEENQTLKQRVKELQDETGRLTVSLRNATFESKRHARQHARALSGIKKESQAFSVQTDSDSIKETVAVGTQTETNSTDKYMSTVVTQLKKETSELRSQLAKARGTQYKADIELEKAKQTIHDEEGKVHSLQEKVTELEKQVTEVSSILQSREKDSNTECDRLRTFLNHTKGSLAEANDTIADLRDVQQQLEREVSDAQAEVAALRIQSETLQKELDHAETQAEEHERVTEDEALRLKAEVLKIKAQLAERNKEIVDQANAHWHEQRRMAEELLKTQQAATVLQNKIVAMDDIIASAENLSEQLRSKLREEEGDKKNSTISSFLQRTISGETDTKFMEMLRKKL